MQDRKVSKLLSKINVLNNSLLSENEPISTIEKDLLLNYIRQLYECVLEIPTGEKPDALQSQEPKFVQQSIEPEEEQPASDLDVPYITEDELKSDISVPQADPIVSNPVKEPVTEVIEVEANPAIEAEEITSAVIENNIDLNGFSSDFLELFEMKEAKELSEKLSSTPISDLNSGMGINDRFLAINELFGGNADAFASCVNHINGLNSYNEAKNYLLSNIAEQYNWSADDKLKKVSSFIALVKRRFR